jgi:hypothetical protein
MMAQMGVVVAQLGVVVTQLGVVVTQIGVVVAQFVKATGRHQTENTHQSRVKNMPTLTV